MQESISPSKIQVCTSPVNCVEEQAGIVTSYVSDYAYWGVWFPSRNEVAITMWMVVLFFTLQLALIPTSIKSYTLL